MSKTASKVWAPDRPPRKTKEGKYNAKREAVLERAASLFAELGYDAVSLNDLAESLTIAKPTLYHYFKSKDEILLEIKARAQEDIFFGIEAADKAGRTGLEKIDAFVRHFVMVTTSDFGRCLMTINVRSLEPGSRQQIQGREKAAEDRVLAFFEEGVKDGSIRDQNIKVAYQTMTGIISWIAIWYKNSGPIKKTELADQVMEILARGIGRA